jgi:hypothetical protein
MILKHKRGQLALMLSFIFITVFVILIAAVFMPMGVLFNTKMYAAGEGIILQANDTISQIHDPAVKAALYDSFSTSLAAQQNNIDVNNSIFQYGWIFIVVLGALSAFLYARRVVEYGYGGLI